MDFDDYKDIKLSNGMNITENKLYEAMKEIGLSPIPQYKISAMTVDFAFLNEMIVIEVNGPCHDTEKQKLKDKKRWFVLRKEGWSRRTFKAEEVYSNPTGVAKRIKGLLNKERQEDFYPEFRDLNEEETLRLLTSKEEIDEIDATIKAYRKPTLQNKIDTETMAPGKGSSFLKFCNILMIFVGIIMLLYLNQTPVNQDAYGFWILLGIGLLIWGWIKLK